MLKKVNSWFFNDYKPIDGRLRFAFYGLLLLTGLFELFIRIPRVLSSCPEFLYQPAGYLSYFPLFPQSPEGMLLTVQIISAPLLIFWVFSALGFLGRLSYLFTGLGVFILWGGFQSCAGTGHTWHLPMYALLLLGFFIKSDRLSLDYYFGQKYDWYPFKVKDKDDRNYSGFARKLVLILAVFTLFAGGVSKILYGGIEWGDGNSLYYYLTNFNNPVGLLGNTLYNYILNNPWPAVLLSVWTLVFELGIVFILFFRKWRLFFVLNAFAFHLGIYFLMLPKYFPQMVCYLLVINWSFYDNRFQNYLTHFREEWKKLPFFQPITKNARILPNAGLSLFGFILIILLVTSMVFKIEKFPLTYIPMYSTYLSENRFDKYEWIDFDSIEGVENILGDFTDIHYPWFLKFYLPERINLEVKLENDDLKIIDQNFLIAIRNNWPVWYKSITEALIADYHYFGTIHHLHKKNNNSSSEVYSLLNGVLFHLNYSLDNRRISQIRLKYNLSFDDYFIIYNIEVP